MPTWVIVSSATAIALGTYSGGWRIIRTMGTRIIKMDSAQGFSAQGAGAAVILASSHFGFPLSTTHVISGGVMGAGAGKRLSAVRWGVAGNIVDGLAADAARRRRIGAAAYGVHEPSATARPGTVVRRIGLAMVTVAFARPDHGDPVPVPAMRVLATVVDTKALLADGGRARLVAGIGVTSYSSLAIFGCRAARATQPRRGGRGRTVFAGACGARRTRVRRGDRVRHRRDDHEVVIAVES